MTIHTFGDSHCQSGWCAIPGVIPHHLGPMTAFRVGRDGLRAVDISEHVEPGEVAVFCFGEIDCRCHVHGRSKKSGGFRGCIRDIVEHYFYTILKNGSACPDAAIAVYSIPPAARTEGVEIRIDREFPFCGTDIERSAYVMCFNAFLASMCRRCDYTFLDVHDKYCDCDGFLDTIYSLDHVHIHDPVFIKEAIKGLL